MMNIAKISCWLQQSICCTEALCENTVIHRKYRNIKQLIYLGQLKLESAGFEENVETIF